MTTKEIPQPELFGEKQNLPLLNPDKPLQSLMNLAKDMGEIFKFEAPGRVSYYVSSHRLVKEVCDESRFDKNLSTALKYVSEFTGDGLFTSWTHDKNWRKAHNILLPSFSQQAMKGYHAMMADIAVQLIQKWERLNPDEHIEVPEDMTRLTLDTIGLCGFNYRFNSFYREQPHPFITSMVRALDESMMKLQRTNPNDPVYDQHKRQFQADIQMMNDLVDKIIAERKAGTGEQADDLLTHMLEGKDPETGEPLDDENIRYQIITFLIAGHETTSGLLSFTLYFLLKNPHVMKKAQEEAARVLVDPVPTYKQVKQLKYTGMVLNEALRLWPTAPAFSLYSKEDTLLGGDYFIEKNAELLVLSPQLHRDASVWGDDVEEFRPERFENPSAIPQHAMKAFGNGQRACIGQQFALHEATLVLGMMMKHFDFEDHTNYELDVKETLTLKPEGFVVKAKSKKIPLGGISSSQQEKPAKKARKKMENAHNTPLLILYGSNMGTAEGTARDLADIALSKGFAPQVATLDAHAGNLPREGAVLLISASYNGHPPDNAKQFVEWLEQASTDEVKGVRYSVLGCGDKNWATTYQKVPAMIDKTLAAKGAERLADRGEADASDDFEGTYEEWREQMWSDLAAHFNLDIENQENTQSTLSLQLVESTAEMPLAKMHDAFTGKVVVNKELQQNSERSTRHLGIQLPEGVAYHEGDHLGVIPRNSEALIHRAATRFNLDPAQQLRLDAQEEKLAHLPLGRTLSVKELLHYVELQEPATRAQLRAMAAKTVCPPHKVELEALLEKQAYKEHVLQKRLTMLELLEKYPACEMEFSEFIALLPSMRPRYYSISSSPRANEEKASITVSVVSGEAWSGNGEYKGIASNYLASLQAGDAVTCFVSTPQASFSLPENPETPIIMVGPGTGIAPFRGFVQAREQLKADGNALGEAHLYFGCRSPHEDFLYQEELENAQKQGLLSLHTAFSRMAKQPKTYVQHVMEQDGKELIGLLDQGAHFYICGDGSQMAPSVEATLVKSYADVHQVSVETAQQWLLQLEENGRYAKDVWAG